MTDLEKTKMDLATAGIPISTVECRSCADPCNQGHDEWQAKLDIDQGELLGNIKPYYRQLVISTGKKDWVHEVSEESGSLALFLDETDKSAKKSKPEQATGPTVNGVFAARTSDRIALLNGSHRSVADDDTDQTVLIFPDYTFVTNIELSEEGAQHFWKHSVDPSLGHGGAVGPSGNLQTKILPYSCVILLCSHKKRDNRCAIAAPKLEAAFAQSLTSRSWGVDHHIDEGVAHDQSPLEDFKGTPEERAAEIKSRRMQAAAGTLGHEKKALIVFNSHIGQHKFAGNVIIYTPTASGVWYGRVSSHEVDSIVENTIIGGKVLPPLLRGGVNLQRAGGASLNDW